MSETASGAGTSGGTREGGELRLTDEGLEMPEMLRGYTGQFEMKVPNVTGQFNTTDSGLPDEEFWDGPLAVYPAEGTYHEHLDEGEMVLQCRGYPNTLFQIVDEREEVGEDDE